MSIWELVKTGGWVMYPLALCSIAVWGVCVERFLAYRQWKEKNKDFLLSFSNLWIRGEKSAAVALAESSQTDVAILARELSSNKGSQFSPTRFERKRAEVSLEFKKLLWVLGTIGSASPFIGLFGTVVGIIKSFQHMSESGSGGFATVAAGLSEALVATAAGIIVAVIAVFFYNFLQVRASQMQFQFKLYAEELLELVTGENR